MKQIHRPHRLTALLLALVMLFSLAPAALAEGNIRGNISLNGASISFGGCDLGYTVGNSWDDTGCDVKPHRIEVAYQPATSDQPAENAPTLSATLSGQESAFQLSSSTISWNAEYYEPIEIAPVAGLPVGNYTATLTISGEGVNTITATANFEVAAPSFIAVERITGVSTSMTAGTPLALTGTVEPGDATVKDITWELMTDGTTAEDAKVEGSTLTATGAGEVKVLATVSGGINDGKGDYTQEFTVTVDAPVPVFVPVTNITGVPTNMMTGESLTLTGTVEPGDATVKDITWSLVSDGTTAAGADISNGILTATGAGEVKVLATVSGGINDGKGDYTQEFTVTVNAPAPVFVPVTNITGVPTNMMTGESLTLTGTVEPGDATKKDITWELVTDGTTAEDAKVEGNTLTATGAGTAKVKATVAGGINDGKGDYTQDFTVTVYGPSPEFIPVTNITGVPTTMTVGTALTLTGMVVPDNATMKNIDWEVVADGFPAADAKIEGNTLTATKEGDVTVRATVRYGGPDGDDYSQDFTISVQKGPISNQFRYTDPLTGDTYTGFVSGTGDAKYLELVMILPHSGATTLAIPEEIPTENHGTLPVRLIVDGAIPVQGNWDKVTHITLPDTVESIGKDNFVGLPALVSVNLPANLKTMGSGCFRDLPELTELTFPASLTTMPHGSVMNNAKLGKVTYLGAPRISDWVISPEGTLPQPFTGCAEGFTIYGPAATPMQEYAAKKGIAYVVPAEQWDYFPFANSYDDFFHSGEAQRYNLTDNDWQVMRTNLTRGGNTAGGSQYNALKYYSNTTAWGGSCYGIAVSEGLFSYGYLGSNALAAGKPSAAAAPRADDQVESLINYHFLLQLLPDFAGEITWGCRLDEQYYYLNQRVDYTDELRALVQTVEQRPILLCYWFPVQMQGGYALSGHAIIVHTAEKVSDTEYRLLAEDNRFPGQDTPITVSLSGNGDMNLSYPAGYRGSENMLGIRYTGDFKQFYSKMPYRNQVSYLQSMQDFFFLEGQSKWDVYVDEDGMIRLRPAAATLAEDDAVIQLPTTSDGRISLRNMIVSSTADGQPAPTQFLYDVQGVNGIVLESDSNQPVNLAYATSSGFSGISAAGAGTVTLVKDGTVEGQDLNGPVTLATSAGDGTLITVKGTATGAETDDFKLTPGQAGVSITAPAGTYTVDMSTQDGRETTSTVTSDGTKPVDVQTPPPPPTPSGGGGSGGGGSSASGAGGGSTSGADVSAETARAGGPTTGVVKPSATVKDGVVKLTLSDRDIQNAIDKAMAQAKRDKTKDGGISVAIDLTGLGRAFDKLPLTLSKAALNKLVQGEVTALTIRTGQITLSLDLETLKAIADAAAGDVTLTADRADLSALDAGAKEALTGRPAYDLTVKSGSKTISDFGKGAVTITLPYTIQGGEQADSLRLAWVDAEGKVQTLDGSAYDTALKAVTGKTGHFTLFGITAEQSAPTFTDIAGHWAENDILFVADRGLLNGTGNGAFTPDGTMTRGMAVTALYRLAGSPQAGSGGAFTDVPAGAYYADAVAWASSKGIVRGTTATTFDPDRPVTRQELAVIMSGYAQAMGHKLPAAQSPVTFSDADTIGSWAVDGVSAIQQAGIMNGKDGNRFDPTGTATRAEVAAVLRRFTETVIGT